MEARVCAPSTRPRPAMLKHRGSHILRWDQYSSWSRPWLVRDTRGLQGIGDQTTGPAV